MSKNKVKNRSQRAKKRTGKRKNKKIIKQVRRNNAVLEMPKPEKKIEPMSPLKKTLQDKILSFRQKQASNAKELFNVVYNASSKQHKSQDN